MSADRIRLALNEMEICIMREKNGRKLFAYPTSASDDAKKIYSLLGLNWIAQPFIACRRKIGGVEEKNPNEIRALWQKIRLRGRGNRSASILDNINLIQVVSQKKG